AVPTGHRDLRKAGRQVSRAAALELVGMVPGHLPGITIAQSDTRGPVGPEGRGQGGPRGHLLEHPRHRALPQPRLASRYRRAGYVGAARSGRRRMELVLYGDGLLAARREAEGPRVVRPGGAVDGQEPTEGRGASPFPGGSRERVGAEREEV